MRWLEREIVQMWHVRGNEVARTTPLVERQFKKDARNYYKDLNKVPRCLHSQSIS